MAGWPTDAELADELGLAVAGAFSDDTRITSANAAAIADAINTLGLLDPAPLRAQAARAARAALGPNPLADITAPDLDDGQFKAVLGLGVWWYEVRNRPEGLDSLNPVASPYQRRTMLQILARGKLAVG
jgi:hypothetical protein